MKYPTVVLTACTAVIMMTVSRDKNQVDAVELPFIALAEAYTTAYNRLTAKATTLECKNKIMQTFQQNWEAFFHEEAMPYEREPFHSQCPLPGQSFFPPIRYEEEEEEEEAGEEIPPAPVIPRREDEQAQHETLGILYVMLVHQDPEFVSEIIEALNEPMHTFVIHVDTKSPQTYEYLSRHYTLSSSRNDANNNSNDNTSEQNVFVMHDDDRVETNWGAFSIVEATLKSLQFGLMLNRSFDYVIDISGTTHPIKTNEFIRKYLSRNVNYIYNGYNTESLAPLPEFLYSYVECDGFVHRVARLTRPRGIAVYGGSQWFAMPRHVAEWFITDPLPVKYKEYAQHVVVADEQYFATMLLNSPYCEDMMNRDVNYLIFTDFLAERGNIHKCLHPDPLHCGRSPTTLTMSMHPTIQMSHALFARKFSPSNVDSMALLATIKETLKQDQIREQEEHRVQVGAAHSMEGMLPEGINLAASEYSSWEVLDNATGESFMIVLMEGDDEQPQDTEYDDKLDDQYQQDSNNKFTTLDSLANSNCLSFPASAGEPMEVVACRSEDYNQRFVKSNCVHINSSEFPEFAGEEEGAGVLQDYCSLRGVIKGNDLIL
jgi:hypothetical protein